MFDGNYTLEPQYSPHGADEDIVNVLVCQIVVWEGNPKEWFTRPQKGTIITEVENIEISESYLELISNAVIRLPKGAIVEDTLWVKSKGYEITSGNGSKSEEETSLSEATRYGELLTVDTSVSNDGDNTLSIDGTRSDQGMIVETAKETRRVRLADADDFAIGNRIDIRIGYLQESTKETIAEKITRMKNGEIFQEISTAFTGFITGCSVSTPLEIECESMASLLKKKACPKGVYKGDYTVHDFFKEGGKFDLLKGTGLSMCDWVQPLTLGSFEINDNLSVYGLLYSWRQKNGIYSMLSGTELAIGMLNVERDKFPDDKTKVNYRDTKYTMYLEYDWDVVNDSLKVTKVEKEYIVINAKAHQDKTKTFRVMVGKVDGKFHHEKHDYLIRGKQKKKGGQKNRPAVISKFDTTKYMIITRDFGLVKDMDTLIKKAEAYWSSYNPNGISGTLTIFGGLKIAPGDVVGLVSQYTPEKNGIYVVESVKTSFGVNGFRQELTIPNKISDFDKVVRIVE